MDDDLRPQPEGEPAAPAELDSAQPRRPSLKELSEALQAWARGLKPESWVLGAAIVAGLYLCFGSQLHGMIGNWKGYTDYHHCAMVPFIALWICWRRYDRLAAIAREPSMGGLIPLGIGLALRWVGEAVSIPSLSLGAFLPTLWGLIWCYWGRRMALALFFPVAFLIFMVPVPFPILAAAGFPMQTYAAIGVGGIGKLLGLPIVRHGTTLSVYDFNAAVVQECSGLHSLFALSMIGTLLAAEMRVPLWKKCLMVALILPIVFGANVLRILLTIFIAIAFGAAVAEGVFHWGSGIMLFGVSVLTFLYLRQWLAYGTLRRRRRYPPRARPTRTTVAPEPAKPAAPAESPPPVEWDLGDPRW